MVPIRRFNINHFDFIQQLPRDPLTPNVKDTPEQLMRISRAVMKAAYSFVIPEQPPEPKLLITSPSALQLIDLDIDEIQSSQENINLFIDYFSGRKLIPGSQPWSHCYAGHQFGYFAGQLGDGRAISLGQYKNKAEEIWELQLKGSGNTPYSRFGDGFAVLRSSIREFLCSEHFHALGIPTSRASSIITTGQPVQREEIEPGAIVTRLAPSWLRFGSFEIFLARKDKTNLLKLLNYTQDHFFPQTKDFYEMFNEIVNRTAITLTKWQLYAWAHGVLNTDNISILGLTIDYGPFAFLDKFDPDHISNHSDELGRYTLRQQPSIMLWNLHRLADCFSFVMDDKPLRDTLEGFPALFDSMYCKGICEKLGFTSEQPNDKEKFVKPILSLMEKHRVDYTSFFRNLGSWDHFNPTPLFSVDPDSISSAYAERLKLDWHEDLESKKKHMNSINPKFILRPSIAQAAIDGAFSGTLEKVFHVLLDPFSEVPKHPEKFGSDPWWERLSVVPSDEHCDLVCGCSS